MKKLSIVFLTLLLNLFAFGQEQTIEIREHEREDGSTFTTAAITTEGKRFWQTGWAEGTGNQAILDAIKDAQNSDKGAQAKSSNVMPGPDGKGDLQTGSPIIVITIGNPSQPGTKIPQGIPRVKYENQQQFTKSIKKDLSLAKRKR